MFTLESNGTLKTAVIFDYETYTSLAIRVAVSDGVNAGVEGNFTVAITDVSDHQNQHEENPLLPPLLRTNSVTSLNTTLLISQENFSHPEIIPKNWTFGFQISTSIFFDDVQEIIIEGLFEDGDLSLLHLISQKSQQINYFLEFLLETNFSRVLETRKELFSPKW